MEYPSDTISAITRFLFIGEKKENIKKSDLVIVLGNEMIEGTISELNDMYRKEIIASDAAIILTGATGTLNAGERCECERMYECAVEIYKMPSELFHMDNRATNTYQNFMYSKEIIEKIGGMDSFSSILCIGKAFLMRRAYMYAAKLEYPSEKMQYYGTVDTQGKNIGADSWWKSEDAINRVMAEIERIGKYYAGGHLSIF